MFVQTRITKEQHQIKITIDKLHLTGITIELQLQAEVIITGAHARQQGIEQAEEFVEDKKKWADLIDMFAHFYRFTETIS